MRKIRDRKILNSRAGRQERLNQMSNRKWTETSLLKHLVEYCNDKEQEGIMEYPILFDARSQGYDDCLKDARENAVVWLFDIVQELLERMQNDEKIPAPRLRTILYNMKMLRADTFYDAIDNNWNPVMMDMRQFRKKED